MISNLIAVELAHINTNHPDFIGGSKAVAGLMEREQKVEQEAAARSAQQAAAAAASQQHAMHMAQQAGQGGAGGSSRARARTYAPTATTGSVSVDQAGLEPPKVLSGKQKEVKEVRHVRIAWGCPWGCPTCFWWFV